MGFTPFSQQLGLLATTGINGFALQNGTPTILSWTAPNDGQLHRVQIANSRSVGSTETGGAVGITYTDPGGTTTTISVSTGGSPGGGTFSYPTPYIVIGAGTTISVVQTSALTSGAATWWVEIWGS